MMDIKIEFPADRHDIAKVLGDALTALGGMPAPRPVSGIVPDHHEGASVAASEVTSPPRERDDADDDLDSKSDATGEHVDDPAQVDINGVKFNPGFCGKAKEPFYASGANKGRWKKRKGVSDADYSAWYESTRPAQTSTGAPPGVNTAAAFGGQQPASTDVPQDCGTFMGWVSAHQAAGHINQHDVTDAYGKLNIAVTDLFPPNDPQTIAGHVAALYAELGGA